MLRTHTKISEHICHPRTCQLYVAWIVSSQSVLIAYFPQAFETKERVTTVDSECLKWLLTVIVENHLPRSAVKRLLATGDDCLLGYIPVNDSKPDFVPHRPKKLITILDILYSLVRESSEACQTFIELGGIMIVGEAIQVGYVNIHEICCHLVTSCTLSYEIMHL